MDEGILGVGAFSAEFACSCHVAPGFLAAPEVKGVWLCVHVCMCVSS